MNADPNDVVRVYSGPLVDVEAHQMDLKEAGIESRVVGTALTSVFGGALPDTTELWVHRSDVEKATATIERSEKRSQERHHRHQQHTPHDHPTNSPKPGPAPERREPYINPNFGG
jgi:hypothetical protein